MLNKVITVILTNVCTAPTLPQVYLNTFGKILLTQHGHTHGGYYVMQRWTLFTAHPPGIWSLEHVDATVQQAGSGPLACRWHVRPTTREWHLLVLCFLPIPANSHLSSGTLFRTTILIKRNKKYKTITILSFEVFEDPFFLLVTEILILFLFCLMALIPQLNFHGLLTQYPSSTRRWKCGTNRVLFAMCMHSKRAANPVYSHSYILQTNYDWKYDFCTILQNITGISLS